MKYLHDLKDMLCEELEEYAGKGELSAGSLDVIHKMTDVVKNIDKILMLEEYDYEVESHGNHDGANYHGGKGGRYTVHGEYGGTSYKRDRYGRYSRDDGKGRMMVMVDELMGMASDENQRTAIRRMKEELERI
jgi:hypothetical protein